VPVILSIRKGAKKENNLSRAQGVSLKLQKAKNYHGIDYFEFSLYTSPLSAY
jgi:hypothetical protein